MQAAGIPIVFVIKFSACVQLGVNYLNTGDAQSGVHIDGHAAPVVPYTAGTILMQRDSDLVGEIVSRLINTVIHDLP